MEQVGLTDFISQSHRWSGEIPSEIDEYNPNQWWNRGWPTNL